MSNHERDKQQGLGLGLSIVRRLITSLEHELKLNSSVGGGTTASITMQFGESASQIVNDEAFTPCKRNLTMLPDGIWVHLIDDEESVQSGFRAFLETLGIKVTTSDSSATAIEFLSEADPDAVLIDLRLRLRNGDSGLLIADCYFQHYLGVFVPHYDLQN